MLPHDVQTKNPVVGFAHDHFGELILGAHGPTVCGVPVILYLDRDVVRTVLFDGLILGEANGGYLGLREHRRRDEPMVAFDQSFRVLQIVHQRSSLVIGHMFELNRAGNITNRPEPGQYVPVGVEHLLILVDRNPGVFPNTDVRSAQVQCVSVGDPPQRHHHRICGETLFSAVRPSCHRRNRCAVFPTVFDGVDLLAQHYVPGRRCHLGEGVCHVCVEGPQ